MKKSILVLAAVGGVLLLTGCSSTPVAFAPVGPNPAVVGTSGGSGQLEVFSALSGRSEGNNPTWYQHSDYYICNDQGQRLDHVDNAVGYYARAPRIVTLPPGKYFVKAHAKGALWTTVPVVIASGEITKVHLDGQWQPPASNAELVREPAGYPVGWRAEE